MIYWIAGAYAVALLGWLAVVEVTRWRNRRQVLDRWQKAIPRWSDPDAPTMSESRCAELGHSWVTKKGDHPWKSCPRCRAFQRVERTAEDHDRDFDVRR